MKLLDELISRIRGSRGEERKEDIEDILKKALRGEALEFEEAMSFLGAVEAKLSREPQVKRVKGKVVFIGDTHGDFDSSKEVLRKFKDHKLVFLGDYVDRGKKQIENANFLLAHYYKDPDRVILLRGNHESPVVNLNYGFMETLYHTYGSEWPFLFMRYNEVFANLPYAAEVSGLLALHGGIAEGLESVKQIRKLPKKDMIPSDKIAFQLLWNDPYEGIEGFGENYSRGGGTKYYGRKALESFLKSNGLKGLVRAHEAYPDGYAWLFDGETGIEGMESILLSVFTCRYYGIPPTVAVFDGKKVEVVRL